MRLSPPQAFDQALRGIREEQHLSQEEAALNGGVDRAHFGHIERGTRNPSLHTVWKIADALGVPPSTIFLRAENLLAAGRRRRKRRA
jgi:transcriptional regulator with XRE-family HTH domain